MTDWLKNGLSIGVAAYAVAYFGWKAISAIRNR